MEMPGMNYKGSSAYRYGFDGKKADTGTHMAVHRYVRSTESYLANHMKDLQTAVAQLHPIH